MSGGQTGPPRRWCTGVMPGGVTGDGYPFHLRYSFGDTPSSFLNTLLKYFSS
jgi:hypothetical protein